MSGEYNPLVQRVDALLRRHQQQVEQAHAHEHAQHEAVATEPAAPSPPAAVPDADEGIPVLTEIVDAEALSAPPAEDLSNDALVSASRWQEQADRDGEGGRVKDDREPNPRLTESPRIV